MDEVRNKRKGRDMTTLVTLQQVAEPGSILSSLSVPGDIS